MGQCVEKVKGINTFLILVDRFLTFKISSHSAFNLSDLFHLSVFHIFLKNICIFLIFLLKHTKHSYSKVLAGQFHKISPGMKLLCCNCRVLTESPSQHQNSPCVLKFGFAALTSVAQLVGHHIAKRKISGSISVRAHAWVWSQ